VTNVNGLFSPCSFTNCLAKIAQDASSIKRKSSFTLSSSKRNSFLLLDAVNTLLFANLSDFDSGYITFSWLQKRHIAISLDIIYSLSEYTSILKNYRFVLKPI